MPDPRVSRSGDPQMVAQIKRARSQETFGIACEACGSWMEFDFPVTFYAPPLCEACESEEADG